MSQQYRCVLDKISNAMQIKVLTMSLLSFDMSTNYV